MSPTWGSRAGRGSRALRVGAGSRSPPGSPQLAAGGSTAASYRPRSCLCSGAGAPCAPAQPTPSAHGLSRRRRPAEVPPLHLWPGLEFRLHMRTRGDARGRDGQGLRARRAPRMRKGKSRHLGTPPQHFINIKKVGYVPSIIQNTYGHDLI